MLSIQKCRILLSVTTENAIMADKQTTAEKVTEIVVKALENGTIPWRRPWRRAGNPRNFVSNKPYRGINWFITTLNGDADPRYMTYKQAAERGWQVRKGEHGIPIVFWNFFDSRTEMDKNGKPKKIPFLRHFTVFNVSQIDGDIPKLDLSENPLAAQPIEVCESVVNGMPNAPIINWEKDKAYYSPAQDCIGMPPRALFDHPEEVYSTLFHELVHSTGHKSRLGRDLEAWSMQSGSYAREELIAEMGAAMLCDHCGISCKTLENSSAYIATWLQRLKNDVNLVIRAAGNGQKAMDFILNVKTQDNAVEPEPENADTVLA